MWTKGVAFIRRVGRKGYVQPLLRLKLPPTMQASVGYVGCKRAVVKFARKSLRIINEASGQQPIELNHLTGLRFRDRTAKSGIFKKMQNGDGVLPRQRIGFLRCSVDYSSAAGL